MADSSPTVGPTDGSEHNSAGTPLIGVPHSWDVMSYNSAPYQVEVPQPSSSDDHA